MNLKIYLHTLMLMMVVWLHACAFSQESGLESITREELAEHLTFLASDELRGRATGEEGLDLAAAYLATQARKMGLMAVDENGDYYQEYTLVRRTMEFPSSRMVIRQNDGSEAITSENFYFLEPVPDTFDLAGEVVFGGYGIISAEENYNDLARVDIRDRIVVIMDGIPRDGGAMARIKDRKWYGARGFRAKIPELEILGPRAIILVPGPGSGNRSMDQPYRSMTRRMARSRYVEELGSSRSPDIRYSVPVIFAHREVMDLLAGIRGRTFEKLQNKIDSRGKPAPLLFRNTRMEIHAEFTTDRKKVPNVAGLIEGSDPELKEEILVYSAHFDHLGISADGEVYNGADDNASGCVSLLEIAEAFMKERKNLKRSVLMLWVSGEEIGLYGSKFYAENPLLPLENTLADINLDMVGAVRTARDTGMIHSEKVTTMGIDSIQLIGGHQSTELLEIHKRISGELGLVTDYSKSSPNHPYRYYYRSDQFNFAEKDVPVLFYSTGNHVDYHKVTDDLSRINFDKLLKVTEFTFLLGYELVTMPERIVVDNPYSGWGDPGSR